jgi:hypothetical protein
MKDPPKNYVKENFKKMNFTKNYVSYNIFHRRNTFSTVNPVEQSPILSSLNENTKECMAKLDFENF